MIKGLYTAAAGMLANTIAMDTMANNMANVNTPAFKKNEALFQSFPEIFLKRIDDQGTKDVGSVMSGSTIYGTVIDFSQGDIRKTGNQLDMAIDGDGFFTIKSRKTGETYYTRSGTFKLDENGILTTLDGDYVQGKLGNILLGSAQGFNVNKKGYINNKNQGIDTMLITRFENENSLEKFGETLFKTTSGTKVMKEPPIGAPLGFEVLQEHLEEANTNAVAEMVNSIQGVRLYEALQKNIHIHNQTLEKAVNEVGRYQ